MQFKEPLFGSVKHLLLLERSTDHGQVDRKGICLKNQTMFSAVKRVFETNCNPNPQLHRLIGLDWTYLTVHPLLKCVHSECLAACERHFDLSES